MRTTLIWTAKGGGGKSTLTRELAVAGSLAGRRVAVVDLDPQGSLTGWYGRRQADTPALVTTPPGAWDPIAAAGFAELFIDTPPGLPEGWRRLVASVDVVIVPVRPSPDDLLAAAATAERLAGAAAAWAFVLTQAPPRSRLADGAVRQLAAMGRLAPVTIGFRTDYPTAAVTGMAAVEYPGTKAADEIADLRKYVEGLRSGRDEQA